MGKIVLLDDATINKIAAGEVIERPASVVKEIMENSIDAGANKITVEIRNGGISYIRVTDNGKGIMQDDMEIAFERHATSKLRNADELGKITSMGFRGEALASIAAIAKVDLVSKTADATNGYEVVIEGGKILSKSETGCSNGTSITIENLFYNTPVRYKFLKKDFTESGYIEDAVTRIALVHPEISIRLINTGKTIIQTSGNGEIKDVIYGIYGKEVAENLINVDYKYDDIEVQGVIGKPQISRTNRSNQLFFVNKRFVKDKTLSSATEQAFKGYTPIGKHGFLVLNIAMDPQKVDVNVHPAKLEVRFQEESKIFKAIYHAIRDSIVNDEIANSTKNAVESNEEISLFNNTTSHSESSSVSKNTSEFAKTSANSFEKNFSNSYENKSSNEIGENSTNSFEKIPTNDFGTTKKVETVNPEEAKTEETFEDVMKKLRKMQNIIITAGVGKPLEDDDNKNEKNAESADIKAKAIVDRIMQENGAFKSNDEMSSIQNNASNETTCTNEIENVNVNTDRNADVDANINQNSNKDLNEEKNADEKVDTNFENKVESLNESSEKFESMQQDEQAVADSNNSAEIKATVQDEQNSDEIKNSGFEIRETENEYSENSNFEDNESESNKIESGKTEEHDQRFLKMYEKNFGVAIKKKEEPENDELNVSSEFKPVLGEENVSMFEGQSKFATKPVYKFIGLAFEKNILLEMKDNLYIIDQTVAQERIMFEQIRENYYSNNAKNSQLMLLPDVINLSRKQMSIYQDNREMFKKAGFTIDEFGENTVKLSGVPEVLIDLETKDVFIEVLEEINTVSRISTKEVEEKFIASVASKASEKVEIITDRERIIDLLDKLLVLPEPFKNVNGRNVAIKMSKTDIEKKFSRRK